MPVGVIDQDMVVPRSGAGFEVHMITGKARSLLSALLVQWEVRQANWSRSGGGSPLWQRK